MNIKATDSKSKEYRVFLDGRSVPYATAANEEEGWVEVLDTKFIGMIAPITQSSNTPDDTNEVEQVELKVKRLHGKVEIKRAPIRTFNPNA